MDILIEILLEVYMELMLLITHTNSPTKTQRIIAKIIAINDYLR